MFHDERTNALRITGTLTDITDRKIADEALRRSEERFSLAVAGSADGIWDWDILTGEMFFSERTQRLHGLEPGLTVRQRSEWRAMYQLHPDDVESQSRAINDYVAGRAPAYDGEWRVRQADGSYRWVRGRGACVRDETGRATRMVGAVSDIDSRRSAEDALRLSEHRYALAMEATGDGHWDWNIPGSTKCYVLPPLLLENDRGYARRLTTFCEPGRVGGRVPVLSWGAFALRAKAVADHFAGKTARLDERNSHRPPWRNALDPYDRPAARATLRGRLSAGRARSPISPRASASTRSCARGRTCSFSHRRPPAVAFEWRIGAGEGENRWSPDLRRCMGWRRHSTTVRTRPGRALVHPDDWPNVRAAIKAAQASGDVAAEYRVVHKGGAIKWLQAKGRMFFDPDGTPTRIVGFMLDVTDRHVAEEELQRMEHQLRQAQRLRSDGNARGRHRARLQQPPRRNPGLWRNGAARRAGGKSFAARPGEHPDRRRARPRIGGSHPGVQPQRRRRAGSRARRAGGARNARSFRAKTVRRHRAARSFACGPRRRHGRRHADSSSVDEHGDQRHAGDARGRHRAGIARLRQCRRAAQP